MSELARRYNKGKLRWDLVPHGPLRKIVEVYTKGAHKHTLYVDEQGMIISGKDISLEEAGNLTVYESGDNNWRKGMPWMSVYASAQRHIQEWLAHEEIDHELGTEVLANAIWNLITLLEYKTTHPELDNRPKLRELRIGWDIDDVCCDFISAWCKRWDIPIASYWSFDRKMKDRFEEMKESGELNDFLLGLQPLVDPKALPYEPVCYITARTCPSEITEKWLDMHNFPTAKVITVGFGGSKLEAAKEMKLDRFVDDNYKTFVELNNAGIFTYLFNRPHNQRYDVGNHRLYNLKDVT